MQERAQQTPVAGNAGDGTVETMGSSQGVWWTPPRPRQGGSKQSRRWVRLKGAWTPLRSPQGGPKATRGASAASGTDQRDGEDPPAVLSGRAAHELSSWGRLPATLRGRTRGQSQRLDGEPAEEQYRFNPEVADALLAAGHEWMKFGSMLKSKSWTTEDAMAMMAGGPAAEENKGELSVRMPSSFPEDVEPPPQSRADVERSQYKAVWHEAMTAELDGHKTTGTYQAATPPRGWKPVGVKWVFSCKTNKDWPDCKNKS